MAFPTDEFKIAIFKRRITIQQIADYFSVSRALVSQVINNYCESNWVHNRLMCMLQDMRADKFTRLEDY